MVWGELGQKHPLDAESRKSFAPAAWTWSFVTSFWSYHPGYLLSRWDVNQTGEVTVILQKMAQGDAAAGPELLTLVYGELRRMAAAKMARESPGQTLQATALVHEAWLRLGGDDQRLWPNRRYFFAAAAEAMRRILVDAARRKHAIRHGGGQERVNLDAPGADIAAPADDAELLAVHEALDRLAEHDARKAEVVKLRYFTGLTLEEIAQALDISEPTAKRDWAYARAWLFKEIRRE
jgi:RNA polymerase sigma factor (TIGR02999 family)